MGDVVDLAAALVDIPSQSHEERELADLVETALRAFDHLEVVRVGDSIVARTNLGREERVILGGHLDTVPSAGNLPSRRDEEFLHGLGSCDMKGGDAVILHIAATIAQPNRDVTYVLYECEEVETRFNGLQRIAQDHPELLEGSLAILMEPSNGGIEAGCQGTLRAEVRLRGVRAHSARSWKGENAVHAAAPVLATLAMYEPRRPVIDGLEYREGLNAVGISGGIAGNVIPDDCTVTVNYRFAPDRSISEAKEHVTQVLDGYDVVFVDEAPAAMPGLERPAAQAFVDAVGVVPQPKFGWTDVARFTALGIPAVNFGPGDPSLAHASDERVPIEQIRSCAEHLRRWLSR
jgi:succinyl-diaminopimelate desuccinylase